MKDFLEVLNSIDDSTYTSGDVVRALRKERGFTAEELGGLTKIGRENISSIENNKIDLGVKRAELLAAALGVNPQDILFPNGKWEKTKTHLEIEEKVKKLLAG